MPGVESSIGVMREGPLHAAIKAILPAAGRPAGGACREVRDRPGTSGWGAGRGADGRVRRLGKKLDQLLDEHRVRIVHPVAAERRIVRIDEDGEVASVRQSPKHATAVAVFDKLVAFPSLLSHPNVTLEVLLLREITSAPADRSPRDGGRGIQANGD